MSDQYKFELTKGGFPDPTVPPKEKESKEYILQYGKSMYSTFTRSGLNVLYNKRSEYRELVKYAQGKQSIDQYKKRLDCFDDQDASWVNLNWEVLNIATKFVNVVVGKLNKTELDTECTPIDPLGIDEKRNYEATLKTFMEMQDWLTKLGVSIKDIAPDIDPEQVPKNDEELAIHMQMNYKNRLAMEMEMALDAAFYWNEYEQTKKDVIYDLVTLGVGAMKVDKNNNTCFPLIERVDPENMVIAMSDTEDCSDVQHIGEVKSYSWSEFCEKSSGQFTQEELKDIQKNLANKTPLGSRGTHYEDEHDMNYTEDRVTVFEFVFKSNDEMVFEKKKDKRGNKKYYTTSYNRGTSDEYKEKYKDGSRSVDRVQYESAYKGSWILGSKYIYNYGKCTDLIEQRGNLGKIHLPYVVYIPNYRDGRNTSLVEQMKPMLDSIQINWLKLQDAIAKAIPKGANIDMEALENLALGAGGKKLPPRKALDLFFKRGITISRRSGSSGRGNQYQPNIIERENGMARDVMNFMDLINQNIQLIRDLTGVNELMDASTPNPKIGKAVAQIAASGGNNALDHLFHAMIRIHEKVSIRTVSRLQDFVKKGENTQFIGALGKSSYSFIKANADLPFRVFGIKIGVKPNDEEWQRFYTSVDFALKQGSITAADEAMIYELSNLKQARQYLVSAEKRHQQKKMMEAQMLSEQNAQVQIQSAQAAEAAKQQTIQLQGQIDLQIEKQRGQNSLAAMELKYNLENQGSRESNMAKSNQIQQQGSIDIARDAIKTNEPKEKK